MRQGSHRNTRKFSVPQYDSASRFPNGVGSEKANNSLETTPPNMKSFLIHERIRLCIKKLDKPLHYHHNFHHKCYYHYDHNDNQS